MLIVEGENRHDSKAPCFVIITQYLAYLHSSSHTFWCAKNTALSFLFFFLSATILPLWLWVPISPDWQADKLDFGSSLNLLSPLGFYHGSWVIHSIKTARVPLAVDHTGYCWWVITADCWCDHWKSQEEWESYKMTHTYLKRFILTENKDKGINI